MPGAAAALALYGIRNCDTVRKARAWLDRHAIAYRFHDYRADGVDAAQLSAWIDEHGWERLLNRAGTTFRGLPSEATAALDRTRATALMAAHPALIRRPVLDLGDRRLIGFSADRYAAAFGAPR